MQLTENQTRVFLGAAVVNFAASSIASYFILKRHKEVIQKYNDMRDVGMGLGKIAVYQNALLEDHMVNVDGFDRIVFNDLTKELEDKLKSVGYPDIEDEE